MDANEARIPAGPIETLYREYLRRETLIGRTPSLPEELLASSCDWADQPLNAASQVVPTTCSEWAALVLSITEPQGSSIDWGVLEQATAFARQTLGQKTHPTDMPPKA